jgi:hypothetical protein
MKIELVDIKKVIPYEGNPRRNEDVVDKVASSLNEFGWQQPIVVDKEMVVVAGHTRLLAAKQLKMDEVPIHIADLTDVQAKAYRLTDNRIAEDADWDRGLLGIEIRQLDDLGFDLDLTGFNNLELSNLLIDPLLVEDAQEEWRNMPEFIQGDIRAFRTIAVHFQDQEAVDNFLNLTGKTMTDKTRYLWFPEQEVFSEVDRVYERATTTKHPIYIPSKGRAHTCTTPDLLNKDDIPWILVVEPQDFDEYKARFSASEYGMRNGKAPSLVLAMDENDQGIGYVRNFCKNHSSANGDEYHWQIDDDIKNFFRRINDKNIKCNALDVLGPVEDYIKDYVNVGMAGPKHSLFAFSAKTEIDFNKQICTVSLFNNDTEASWREGVVSDIDYSMQVLTEGWCSVMFNRLLYEPPSVSSNSGGNQASGYYGNYHKMCKGLLSAWKDEDGKDLFKIVEKNGKPRINPNRVWMRFKQQLKPDLES